MQELKQIAAKNTTFNRTIVELKSVHKFGADAVINLLIVLS